MVFFFTVEMLEDSIFIRHLDSHVAVSLGKRNLPHKRILIIHKIKYYSILNWYNVLHL